MRHDDTIGISSKLPMAVEVASQKDTTITTTGAEGLKLEEQGRKIGKGQNLPSVSQRESERGSLGKK